MLNLKAVPLSSEAACYDSQTRLRKVTALPPLPTGRAALASVRGAKKREKEKILYSNDQVSISAQI